MKNFILSFILLFAWSYSVAQQTERQNFKIMCYNVENYFDCVDDSLTDDSEFLPGGMRGWNYNKYQTKQAHISKVITAIGGWEAPALVGMCEVESEKCLIDLTRYSGLKNLRYKFLHHESPVARGIDVALLYQPTQFKPIHDEAIRINFPNAPHSKTRDILFATGIIPTGDTLHVFVCHFPSRLGGELESEEKRMYVASMVRGKADSLFAMNSHANIVIMGDFNDFPTDKSLLNVLNAKPLTNSVSSGNLYNLMYKMHTEGNGTNKHEGDWGTLDQMIVSGNLLQQHGHIFTKQSDAHIFNAGFLLENDKTFLGTQPFRTYVGFKYQEGFSDHLPVYTD
ncbi:MAG TPA: endonuclease, partial [Paludibacter sp.]|nr:endonuclease [Paludibacter sp.]